MLLLSLIVLVYYCSYPYVSHRYNNSMLAIAKKKIGPPNNNYFVPGPFLLSAALSMQTITCPKHSTGSHKRRHFSFTVTPSSAKRLSTSFIGYINSLQVDSRNYDVIYVAFDPTGALENVIHHSLKSGWGKCNPKRHICILV